MSIYKKDIDKYQSILDKISSGFNSFTLDTVNEKEMLIELLKDKINDLKRINSYCDYWHNCGDPDWEDPRL